VNYKDEEKELDRQIQAELRRLKTASHQHGLSLSSTQLREVLKSTARRTIRKLPLSAYLRQLRTSLGATIEEFAVAVDIPVSTLTQLESKENLPWEMRPEMIAQVAVALHLHLTDLQSLTKHSHIISTVSRQLTDSKSAAEAMVSWLDRVRDELNRRGADDLLQ
jgi:transcriptional regulator with XRE-family HTH domain